MYQFTGDSTSSQEMAKYCGSTFQWFPLISTDETDLSQLTLVFQSDVDVQFTGFLAEIYVGKFLHLFKRKIPIWNPRKKNVGGDKGMSRIYKI